MSSGQQVILKQSVSLSDRFGKLNSSAGSNNQTTFRAILDRDSLGKAGGQRRKGAGVHSEQSGRGRGGGRGGSRGARTGGRGGGRTGGKSSSGKPVSKEDLDKEMDIIMGRDPTESLRTNLDNDLDAYFGKTSAAEVAQQ